MNATFFEQPILNSPYEPPTRHHALDPDGQPLDQPPVDGRRRSELITPVPKPRKQQKKSGKDQGSFVLSDKEGLSSVEQEYNPTPIINEIRQHVAVKLGAIARPKAVILVADLPKTRSGKIMRRLLRDVVEGRELGDTTTLADANVVEAIREGAAASSED